MSECVVRMEMPKSCPCELAGGYDIPLPCFAGHGIPKRCKEFDECVEKGTKPNWCPFICALPEGHGRLVDMTDVEDMFDAAQIISDDDCNCGYVTEDLRIEELPTIVPAERSKT